VLQSHSAWSLEQQSAGVDTGINSKLDQFQDGSIPRWINAKVD